jgi:hypothetical protein
MILSGQDDLLEGIKVFWAETAEQVIDQVLLPIGT